MKTFAHISIAACLACLFAVTTVAPAGARHVKNHHHVRMAVRMPAAINVTREPDPYGVYFGGYKVSRDPDPNVRRELLLDYWAIYRW